MSAAVRRRTDTQRAAALVRPTVTELVSAPVPVPGPSEVRVRLEGCGVCASSLPLWEGRPWFEYPRPAGAPGHEGWGRVEAVGAAVGDLAPGDRVALLSGHAYAEYDVADRAAVVRIPREFDGEPFPGEPFGCAMNIWARSDIRPGQRVAVVGAGFLGLLLTQLASRTGAQVVAVSRRASALELARTAGAVDTVELGEPRATIGNALAASGGGGFDRVIEAAGLQSTLDVAGAVTAEYGRLVIAGYHQDGRRQVDMQQWNWKALDVVNAHERSVERYAHGIRQAIAAIEAGRLDPFRFLTHSRSLADLDEAFALTRDRPEGFVKAVVRIGAAS